MRKNILRFFLLSAVTFLSAACTQNEIIAPKGEGLVFTATIADATRTAMDATTAGKVNWVEGDEITINGVVYTASPDASDASTATFTKKNDGDADPEPVEGYYYATYCCSYDPVAAEGVIPASQDYVSAGTINAPMYAESETTSLSFHNICGVLELKLKGKGTVTGIEVSSSNLSMSGAFTIFDAQTATIIDDTKAKSKLDCGDGVALNESEATLFYVPVPDASYTGMKVTVFFADGGQQSFVRNDASTIAANGLYAMSLTVESKFNFAARYSNDGGASWTNTETLKEAVDGIAAGADKANGKVELLKDCTVTDQIATQYKQNFTFDGLGHTVSVSSFPSVTSAFVIDSSDVSFKNVTISGPGYDVKAVNRAFKVSDHATLTLGESCVVTGFNTKGNGGAISCSRSTVNITDDAKIENCQSNLTGTSYTALGGGAIFCESQYGNGSTLNMSGTAKISNCKTDKSGGAITLYGKNTLNLSDNVLIENCTASVNGGAISATTNAATSIISGSVHITGCKAAGGTGGAVYDNNTASSMTLSGDVVIDNCTATDRAGAIYESGILTVKGNTKIEGCSAKFGGGIAIYGQCTLDENALIKNCSATRGGAVIDTAGSASTNLYIKGSSRIESCTASTYGGGLYVGKGAAEISENAVFTDNTCGSSSVGCSICARSSNSTVTINGGTFTANPAAAAQANCAIISSGKINVYGGCFASTGNLFNGSKGYIYLYGGYYTSNATATFVASGYSLVDNPNTTEADKAAYALGCVKTIINPSAVNDFSGSGFHNPEEITF